MKVHVSESSTSLSLPEAKVRGSKSSTYGTFGLRSESTLEQKLYTR